MGSNMTKRFKLTTDLTCPELAGYKLPQIELDGVGQQLTDYIKEKHYQAECIGFIDGYNKAREKYEFSMEDLIRAIDLAQDVHKPEYCHDYEHTYTPEQIISILHTPIAIEVEMDSTKSLLGVWTGFVPALNPDGTVKGRYIYE